MFINKSDQSKPLTPFKAAKADLKKGGKDIQESLANLDPLNRSLLGRTWDHIVSTVRAINFGITRNARGKIAYLFKFRPEFCELNKKETWNKWKDNSKGLVLMLHGLRGHPSQFDSHLRNLKKDKDLDLRVPFITNKGDDFKKKLLDPLQILIRDYIESQKAKNVDPIKICLIGISNGGRLSLMLTKWLAKEFPPEKYPKIELLGLLNAPVLHGTKISSTLLFRASRFHDGIKKDFKYKGKDRKWVKEAVTDLPNTFKLKSYIALDDCMVYPYSAAMLPFGENKNIKNKFFRGEGHISILRGAQKDHLEQISNFFNPADSEK